GGGLPLGACVAGPKWADVLAPGTHGCTTGGNPLCAAAGAAAMKLIEDENLVARAAAKGEQMAATLRDANIPRVREVRGKGFIIGLQLDEAKVAKDVMLACLDRRLIVCVAKNNVVRIAPALTTDDNLLDSGLEILIDVLKA
ncbi:MAG: aminotransferase class III-fold pyridoxal phosphate-dependent enzyme, partial [Phycisphaerae bacterium]|nr:aminotransferase class III-fold pyridoxal phosphate-dependent enzyme [Phycisphaerae bacterium]